MFAEYVAGKKGKIALVSIYLEKMDETEGQSILKRLLEKVVQAEAKTESVGAYA
jgi:PII-like signaling protein